MLAVRMLKLVRYTSCLWESSISRAALFWVVNPYSTLAGNTQTNRDPQPKAQTQAHEAALAAI